MSSSLVAFDGGSKAPLPFPNSTITVASMDSSPTSNHSQAEVDLLRMFDASLNDSTLLDLNLDFDEDELLATALKRKGRASWKLDDCKIGNKIHKKTSKGKAKAWIDDDVADGLLSELLDPNMSLRDLEHCYSPHRGSFYVICIVLSKK